MSAEEFSFFPYSDQRSSQGETLQKQQRDLEFYSEKEERLKKEIEVQHCMQFVFNSLQ